MKPRNPRPYVQARLEQQIYLEASVQLVMASETWQGLLSRLITRWVRQRRAVERRRRQPRDGS